MGLIRSLIGHLAFRPAHFDCLQQQLGKVLDESSLLFLVQTQLCLNFWPHSSQEAHLCASPVPLLATSTSNTCVGALC